MEITPHEASEAIQESSTLDNRRDRRIHGAGTAAAGVVFAAYLVLHRVAAGSSWDNLVTVAYAAVLVCVAAWQTSLARTVPRNARLVGYVGLAASIVAVIPVLGWMSWLEHTGDPGMLAVGAIASLVALPAIVTGLVIATGRGR